MANVPYSDPFFPSAVLSASVTPLGGTGQMNTGHRKVILTVHVTAVGSPGTLDLSILGRDAHQNFYVIPGASLPQITATGDYLLCVGEGLPYVPNESIPFLLPGCLQVAAVVGGGGSFTVAAGWTWVD